MPRFCLDLATDVASFLSMLAFLSAFGFWLAVLFG